jgi:tungstate transport system permease protein
MNDFGTALRTAAALIGRFDGDLREIVSLSLAVSLTASAFAFAICAPLVSHRSKREATCNGPTHA